MVSPNIKSLDPGVYTGSITLTFPDGSTVLGTATANSAGQWTITSTSLADGNHTLTVKQTDYGIEPTTAAGGLVRVENEVVLSFKISARAAYSAGSSG